MNTGNRLLDELQDLNANITLLNSKIDKLESAMNKVVANTQPTVTP